MADDDPVTGQDNDEQKTLQPLKIYLKDVSFETPNSPDIFTQDWKPKLGVEIDSQTAVIEEDRYEVVMTVTVTTSVEGVTAYLAEVHQAGIFHLAGFGAERLQELQNIYCLRFLYPYACAALTDLISKGGFPQLLLNPINFAAYYRQRIQATNAEPEVPDASETRD